MSKKSVRAVGMGVAAALACALSAAPVRAAPAEPIAFCGLPGQQLDIAPVSSLTEGQALTWRSSVKGTAVGTFSATYVTRLDGALGYDAYGKPVDLLLVDLGRLSDQVAGAWSGASGSPVYDASGRLVGAVSYGFSYEGETVAGVTPAAAMKSIGDLPSALPASVPVGAQQRNAIAKVTGDKPEGSLKQIKTVQVTVGATKKQVDDAAKRVAKRYPGLKTPTPKGLAKDMRVAGMPINGAADSGKSFPIEAGGNVAVSYAYGYLAQASVGTVTAVCGDQVWAFGHPSIYDSTQGASIHGASAARIVPDGGLSYKEVTAIGKPVGKLTDDRLAGVKGTLGALPTTVPVTSVSKVGSHASTATTHVSATGLIGIAAAVQASTDAARLLDNNEVGSASVTWTITFTRKGKTEKLTNTNKYSSQSWFPQFVGMDVMNDVAALQTNPFNRVKITGVTIRSSFSPQHHVTKVSRVQVKQKGVWTSLKNGTVVNAVRGKTYSFRALLTATPSSGSAQSTYVPFTVTVPKNIKKTLSLRLNTTGTVEDIFDSGTGESGMGQLPPKSFPEFLALLDNNQRSDQLSFTRTHTKTSGDKVVKITSKTAPTVVDTGKASIKLQVKELPKKATKPAKKTSTSKKATAQKTAAKG